MFEIGTDITQDMRRRRKKSPFEKRVILFNWCLVVLFTIFTVRVIALNFETPKSKPQGLGRSDWYAPMADVVDRNGVRLSGNVPLYNIKIYPKKIGISETKETVGPELAAKTMRRIFPDFTDININKIINITANTPSSITLYQNLDDDDPKIKAIREDKYIKEDERIKPVRKWDWIRIERPEFEKRKYAKGRATAHIVGYVNMAGIGQGVEKGFEKQLKENVTTPLQISIDANVQEIMNRELEKAKAKYMANSVVGILMNSRTGEIIAASQMPSFNPENITENDAPNMKFMALNGTYTIGSVFKIFNTALALESGIPSTREYDVSKPINICGAIKDDKWEKRREGMKWSVEDIMVHSSNIGSAQIARDIPNGAQKKFLERLHLNEPLTIEGFGTTDYRSRISEDKCDVPRIAFGHAITTSLFNLIAAVNSIVNGGIYIKPRITPVKPGEVVMGERVISPEISRKIRDIMYRVATETSGRKALVDGINIGGKTGTAEKDTNRKRNFTTFLSVFPIESPEYIMVVSMDEPKPKCDNTDCFGKTASENAAPASGEILRSIMPTLMLSK
jgi:cell division protein FtsI (penicillin-binding protein 3)